MGRDFSKELKEHQEKREENRLANEQAMNERRANALKGLEERPDLKPHYEAELEAIKQEQANWESAQRTTADNKHREIVDDMADAHARAQRPVAIQTDAPSKTSDNDNAPPPNDHTPRQLTYGAGRLEQSREAANDNTPKEKGSEPEK